MNTLWSVYHPDIPPFLRSLVQTPPMQRLREVGMNCGCEYTSFPRFQNLQPYSRFDHSLGVGLIVWHFTGSEAQAAAGLLHDVATPVFAHVVDFLHGDHLRQESTEVRTAELIASSAELQAILADLHLCTEDVADHHLYPIADNDTPRLSADRLEYTLGNLLNYGLCSAEQLRSFYEDLIVDVNEDGLPELTFRTPETASAFTRAALQTARIYIADEDRFAMEMLARLLKTALQRSVLSSEDLYATERQCIQKLLADQVCGSLWQQFRAFDRISRASSPPASGNWVQVPAKLRCIDPLAQGKGRVSAWDAETALLLSEFQQTRFDYWVGT